MLVLSFITRLWGVLAGRDPAGGHYGGVRQDRAGTETAAMTLTTRIKQTYCSPLRKINDLVAHIRTDHTPPSDIDIDYSEALHILADDRRRHAIEYLASNPTGSQVPLSDLADVVAAQENDCLIEAVTSTQRERVYIALYQQHSEPLSKVAEVDTDRMVFSPTSETKHVWQAYTTFQQELTG